ncbi:MAG: lipase [Paramuribaculum sp.]|nr:lipase [Paramuribaculum sp.]
MKKTALSVAAALLLATGAITSTARTLLFIGDSITDGNWGGGRGVASDKRSHDDFNHIFGHGYMEMTAGYFMSEYAGAGLQFHNRGISGHRLSDMAARWQEDVIALRPDVVSILAGTNDVHHHLRQPDRVEFSVERFRQQLDSLICLTADSLPGVQIAICTPFTAKAGRIGQDASYPERERMIKELAAAVREIAARHDLTVIPFDSLITELTAVGAPEYWVWDGIHPTTAAHYRMSRLWIDIMEPKLALPKE